MLEFNSEKKFIDSIVAKQVMLETIFQQEKESLEKAKTLLDNTLRAQEILQGVSQMIQEKAHEKISSVVSTCLATVFPEDPYEFKIEFERKRGRTEANLKFTRRGMSIDPMEASGGGVIDVAAFALRIACLMLHRPKLSKVAVFDEPFRFVSAQYRENVRAMLDQLSEDLKIQIIMVTHNEEYETGTLIELG